MDVNADKYFYDIDTDGTGELSEYWQRVNKKVIDEWKKQNAQNAQKDADNENN